MKLQEYLNEDLKQTYLKISKKDMMEIKSDLKELESAINKEDIIKIKSSSRLIISSSKRILERIEGLD